MSVLSWRNGVRGDMRRRVEYVSVVAIDPTDTTDSQRAIVVVESRGWWC